MGRGLAGLAEAHVAAGGHAAGPHQLLGVGLRALHPGRLAARPEGPDAGRLQTVHQPGHQRRLGTHHHEIGLALGGGRDEVVVGQALHAVAGDARVARRRQHLRSLRAAQQRADERVLAASAADHQDPAHAAISARVTARR